MWGFELGWHGWGETCQDRIRASVQAARVRMPDIRNVPGIIKVRTTGCRCMFMNLHNYHTIHNSVTTLSYVRRTYIYISYSVLRDLYGSKKTQKPRVGALLKDIKYKTPKLYLTRPSHYVESTNK